MFDNHHLEINLLSFPVYKKPRSQIAFFLHALGLNDPKKPFGSLTKGTRPGGKKSQVYVVRWIVTLKIKTNFLNSQEIKTTKWNRRNSTILAKNSSNKRT